MNLVAKEYVAAQDPEDPGVLVLSQFAGAAEELTDALLMNPYDIASLTDAIEKALEMPLSERPLRWKRTMHCLQANDARRWCRSFLETLEPMSYFRGDTERTDAA